MSLGGVKVGDWVAIAAVRQENGIVKLSEDSVVVPWPQEEETSAWFLGVKNDREKLILIMDSGDSGCGREMCRSSVEFAEARS